jgi:hypothetical protein
VKIFTPLHTRASGPPRTLPVACVAVRRVRAAGDPRTVRTAPRPRPRGHRAFHLPGVARCVPVARTELRREGDPFPMPLFVNAMAGRLCTILPGVDIRVMRVASKAVLAVVFLVTVNKRANTFTQAVRPLGHLGSDVCGLALLILLYILLNDDSQQKLHNPLTKDTIHGSITLRFIDAC